MPSNRSNSSNSVRFVVDNAITSSLYNGGYWTLDATQLYGIKPSDDRLVWVEVESSAIGSIGYNASRETLYVLFKKGDLYCYPNVTKYKYNKLMEADSKGKYLNKSIIADAKKHPPKLMAKGKDDD